MPNSSRNEDSNEKEYKSNSFNICFEKNLINDSFKTYTNIVNNCFIVFKSYFDILHLIYSTNDSSLISYNLIDNKKIIEIKNDFQEYVSSFKHFFDDINKRDLVISISPNSIILWNINNFECLFFFDKIYLDGYNSSSSFLKKNNEIYIITSNNRIFLNEKIGPIRVYTLQGILVKEIKGSNEDTFNIETFFDNLSNKNLDI